MTESTFSGFSYASISSSRQDNGVPRRTLPPEPASGMSMTSMLAEGNELGRSSRANLPKVKSNPYQRVESSIHDSAGSGNVRVEKGQLKNVFEPSLKKVKQKMKGEIPANLVNEFMKSKKNEISILHELAAKYGIGLRFEECAVLPENCREGVFACICLTDHYAHPQGVGRTKKDAKTKAARKTLHALLDIPERSRVTDKDKPVTLPAQVIDPADAERQRQIWCGIAGGQESASSAFSSFSGACARPDNPWQTPLANYGVNPPSSAAPPGFDHVMPHEKTEIDQLFDVFNTQIKQLLTALPVRDNVSRNFCGFVVQKGEEDPEPLVVAVGSGSGFNNEICDMTGKKVKDCHGIVIARRSFLRYLHTQLGDLYNGQESIFEKSSGHRARLKPDILIHVLMSQAPCGDCLNFVQNLDDRELTDQDWELMATGEHHPYYTKADPASSRVHVKSCGLDCRPIEANSVDAESVSCTDKILRWNVLGLQGTLLSALIDPVYPYSFNIGSKYHHGSLVRGICCRMSEYLEGPLTLPEPFELRHPLVGRVTRVDRKLVAQLNDRDEATKFSLNWALKDNSVELVDPQNGQVAKQSPFRNPSDPSVSRISKNNFFVRFSKTTKQAGIERARNLESDTYLSCKKFAEASSRSYCAAKREFAKALVEGGLGRWPEVTFKRQLDDFTR